MKTIVNILLVIATLALTGCKGIAPDGPYGGDRLLYNADLTIAASYDTVHTFVAWELANRATLAALPSVRQYADQLRTQYPGWHRAAIAARTTYEVSATKENATVLQTTLDVLRTAMRQANQLLANSNVKLIGG